MNKKEIAQKELNEAEEELELIWSEYRGRYKNGYSPNEYKLQEYLEKVACAKIRFDKLEKEE